MRMKKAADCKTDKELAKYLEINTTTLSMWKSREKVDYDLIFTKFEHVSLDWLIRGHEHKDELPVDQDVINQNIAELAADNREFIIDILKRLESIEGNKGSKTA